jgi:SAM-dependent methyltransferase
MSRLSDAMKPAVTEVERATIERYSARFEKFGTDPRTLGWDTQTNQEIRFGAVASLIDCRGKAVLDIGCGFGDFYDFLSRSGRQPASYFGIDINPTLLDAARSRSDCRVRYERRNLLTNPFPTPVADVGVMLGVLNFRLATMDNIHYADAMIGAAFTAVREALVVDFLSAQRAPDYPEESFVYYYRPEERLASALALTADVVLKHDYPAIPQKEFVLLLRKAPACG